MTSERFAQLVVSEQVVGNIKEHRRLKAQAEAFVAQGRATDDAEVKELLKAAAQCKRRLPMLMYQAARFDESTSKTGNTARWRRQSTVQLNGLFMVDVDHVADPRLLVKQWVTTYGQGEGTTSHTTDHPTPSQRLAAFCEHYNLLLIHVTPGGQGLRLVARASADVGNLSDNQHRMGQLLGIDIDESCKDASRASFCPGFEDIIYINKELFNYEDKDYNQKFSPEYRGGNSKPTRGEDNGQQAATAERLIVEQLNAGYHGKSYNDIVNAWFARVCKGLPKAGDRHQSLYRLACDLRYITDFNPRLLARIIAQSEVGTEIVNERGAAEIEHIATDACALQRYRTTPRRMLDVLADAGVQLVAEKTVTGAEAEAPIDYGYWWERLAPLLSDSPGLRESVATLPDHHKLGGVLAAGAMLGTYLTRTWWTHFDGKDYRLSFLVYIIGDAASGKSFAGDMDRLLMAPMRAADNVGRKWEREYKEEVKRRNMSSKNAKTEAPEQQHPVIRYVPSTMSNAVLYRRLEDDIDREALGPDGEPMHLHLYTFEAELATALRAQQGSWAGKLDLECKSFQNELAGVDYANDQSANGIYQVNWNQVVTGTPEAMGRKVRPATVLDGLVTRLCLFPMPSNTYAMIERRQSVRDNDRECLLRQLGLWLEEVKGELHCERLVDFCYDYEKSLCEQARVEQDECLDYFRKRIPVIMIRYALVRMVLRQKEAALRGQTLVVDNSDLEFARLIGDWCLMAQMHLFGQQVMEALQREREQFTPRKRSTKIRDLYASLPDTFTQEDIKLQMPNTNRAYASNTVLRWLADGLVEKTNKRTYKKKYKEIPV